jgi:hypothetical protein
MNKFIIFLGTHEFVKTLRFVNKTKIELNEEDLSFQMKRCFPFGEYVQRQSEIFEKIVPGRGNVYITTIPQKLTRNDIFEISFLVVVKYIKVGVGISETKNIEIELQFRRGLAWGSPIN